MSVSTPRMAWRAAGGNSASGLKPFPECVALSRGHVQPALAAPREHVVGGQRPLVVAHIAHLALGQAGAEVAPEVVHLARVAEHGGGARPVPAHDALQQVAPELGVSRVHVVAEAVEVRYVAAG